MMAAKPGAPLKGPKLSLIVGTPILARLEAASAPPGTQTPRSNIQTPSSTVVEYGDGLDLELSAAERAERIFSLLAAQLQAQGGATPIVTEAPRLQTNGTNHVHIATPISEVHEFYIPTPIAEVQEAYIPTPISKDHQVTRSPDNSNPQLVEERLSRYLQTVGQATGDPNKELARQNHGLHQRVAALQRNEQHLVKDNRDLNSHVASLMEKEDTQRRKMEDELREKASLEARIKELEEQVASQNQRITRLTAQAGPPRITMLMSDADVASWYETRAASWAAWVDEFVHSNPNRLDELHPIQQKEVYGNIQSFVRFTQDGKLPEPLAGSSEGTFNTAHLLLNGMLNDFIVTETLTSPFWVFEALSKQSFDLESPTVERGAGSASPIGFRMDLSGWNGSAANLAPLPSPFVVPAAPTTARSISMLSPGRAPPMFSNFQPLNINTTDLSALPYSLPAKLEMQDLLKLLMKTQNESAVYSWRAQLMHMLSDGGLSRDATHPTVVNNEEKKMLANARREYARQLKDRFLGSGARFLLRDQDATGIAKLEGRLVSELDLALRFSAQVWARNSPLNFIGLEELAAAEYKTHDDITVLNQDQHDATPDQPVVMVMLPAIGTLRKVGGQGRVWVKARVVVAPKSAAGTTPAINGNVKTTSPSVTPTAGTAKSS
ncbi:hypothetical protein QBC47DRAFT_168655 [Echria macrotheca]|uniref:Uncharacterized protein n=1 Tax=Echria macrotheca TaxID=438768 RepID=A0AAJ0BEA9_9PEZI|nr:hypothetical protein QBC47DRAFT_168655 [Echria macrotheca]